MTSTSQPVKLLYKRTKGQAAAAATAAAKAAAEEASANASPGDSSGYGHSNNGALEQADDLVANVTGAAAASLAKVPESVHFSLYSIFSALYADFSVVAFSDSLWL